MMLLNEALDRLRLQISIGLLCLCSWSLKLKRVFGKHQEAVTMRNKPPRGSQASIVVIGAGFGGFQAAQSLAGAGADVLLIDRNNYSTFIPLIYQVAAAQIEPSLVAYPVRTKLRGMANVRFLQAQVERIDFDHKQLKTSLSSITYDYLVIATGAQSNYHNVSGAREHTFTLRSLTDAIALRNHILNCFEQAAVTADIRQQRRLLTFVVVGGGATGVETAGALSELLRGPFRHDFAELIGEERLLLVQSGSGLLQEFSQGLGNYTHRHLERLSVDVRLNTRVASVDAASVTFDNDEVVETATVIWTTGVEAERPDVDQPPELAAKGKLAVRATLQLAKSDDVYAIGDVAYFEKDGKSLAGVAPEALQQGVAVARNIRRQLQGHSPTPFSYLNKGRLAIIGGYGGVGRIAGVNFGGIVAWAMWLMVHLVYLPGYRSRLLVLLTWMQNYLLRDRALRQVAYKVTRQR